MSADRNTKSYVGRLRFRLVLVALLSMLIIVNATGYGIYRIFAQHILFQAEEDAVHISEALFVELRDLLFAAGPDGTSALFIDSDRRALLDRRLRRFLHPFNIVKIKIYDDQGEILYSTDPTAIGFILLDIDHFKRINDTFGHLAGDHVLCELAARVQGALRSYDLFGRYGGEEFLAVLPDATLEGAVVVAERVRQAVCGAPFAFEGASVDVTVSLGVATSETGEEALAEVLKRADEGLYLAKDGGRNRVACAEAVAVS